MAHVGAGGLKKARLYAKDPDNSLHPKPLQLIDKAASCNT